MGILGYIGQNYQDYNDWYKITLVEDGSLTLRVLTYQTLTVNTLYLFDSETTTIISSGNWGTDAVVEFPNFAAGNYFVKVPRYTGYGSYYITSTFTPAAFTNDMEPNNIPQNSIFLNIGDTVTGHLGFYGSGSLDGSDWYRFNLLERGKVTFNAVATGPLHFNNLLIFGMDTISLLVYGTWGTKGSVHTIITEPGTYFFKISRYYEYGSYLLTSTLSLFHLLIIPISKIYIRSVLLISLQELINTHGILGMESHPM